MSDELTPLYVLEESRDNPNKGPNNTPDKYGVDHPGAMWFWWRTGPHPQGVWQAMDARDPAIMAAYQANEAAHPIFQDQALGPPSDFGNRVCHACGEMSEGYPEPRHRTECAGLCKRPTWCTEHEDVRSPTPDRVLYVTHDEYEALLKAIEEPAKEIPGLRSLLDKYGEQTVFKQKDDDDSIT